MIKVRASQIVIDIPVEGQEPWIRVVVQRVEKDGNVVNTIDRYDSINVRLSTVINDKYPILVDLSSGTYTPADVAAHLGFVVKDWLAKKYNGTIDPTTGDVIVG